MFERAQEKVTTSTKLMMMMRMNGEAPEECALLANWRQTAEHTSPALAALIKSFRRTKMVTMPELINN